MLGGGIGLGGGSKLYTILHIKIDHQQNASPNALITCIGMIVQKLSMCIYIDASSIYTCATNNTL